MIILVMHVTFIALLDLLESRNQSEIMLSRF